MRRRGAESIRWASLASWDDSELGADLSREAAYASLHARGPDGRLMSGARAFAALWRALPVFRLAGRIAAQTGSAHLLEGCLRGFLKIRPVWRRNATACPLPIDREVRQARV